MNTRNSISERDLVVVCLSNNAEILDNNLLASPSLSGGPRVHVEKDAPSAAVGYNHAMDETTEDYIVFVHHDVYLPLGWEKLLLERIREVEAVDPNWALLGSYGIGADDCVAYGPVWSSSIGYILGRVPEHPVAVQSFDEMLFVLRRQSHIRFDEKLAGFHFYGTDIVQIAAAAGLKSYAVPLQCVHNDKFKGELDDGYRLGYQYMRRKWRQRLPLHTPTVQISWHGLHLIRSRIRGANSIDFRRNMAQAIDVHPRLYAARCGWNDLNPAVQ